MKIVEVPVVGSDYLFVIEESNLSIECIEEGGGYLCLVYYEIENSRYLELFDFMVYVIPTSEVMLEGLEANIKTAIKQIFRLL